MACLLIRKHDHFTPTREIKRHVRALARNHPEGWNLQRHVSPTTTNLQIAARRLRDDAEDLVVLVEDRAPGMGLELILGLGFILG